MTELVLTTFDWVPDIPRGYVRDLRVRWALEEAGLPCRVAAVPFRHRGDAHIANQPFGQVPWLTDDDDLIFESGAILLHLGKRSAALMPGDPRGRSEVIEWVFAALNSVKMATLPWTLVRFSGGSEAGATWKVLDTFAQARLKHMEAVLTAREWLASCFSIADILMADVLRVVDDLGGLAAYPSCRAYVSRAKACPAFAKAHADQLAHFAAAG